MKLSSYLVKLSSKLRVDRVNPKVISNFIRFSCRRICRCSLAHETESSPSTEVQTETSYLVCRTLEWCGDPVVTLQDPVSEQQRMISERWRCCLQHRTFHHNQSNKRGVSFYILLDTIIPLKVFHNIFFKQQTYSLTPIPAPEMFTMRVKRRNA